MTISAKIIADSISPEGIRLTSLQLRYPRFIHSEMMTHRVFSRNASSSRAIPVERLIQDIMDDTAMPIHWGANQKGMQANTECNEMVDLSKAIGTSHPIMRSNRDSWLHARDVAVTMARAFNTAGYHKQIVNRLLEPFSHINVLVTATEFNNFFALRIHPDAQPEICELATRMKEAMDGNTPVLLNPGEWHLPYCPDVHGKPCGMPPFDDDAVKVSVARCGRVSYLTQEGSKPTIEQDLKLYDRLIGSIPLHASPAEHQGTPDERALTDFGSNLWWAAHLWGNFKGWVQFRKTLPGENQA